MRAKLPGLNLPVVIYSILVNSSTTSGPILATTAAAEAFVREQLLAILFGLGLATGVSLFVFPFSSRTVVTAELKELIGLLRKVTVLQNEYLATMTKDDGLGNKTRNAEKREVLQDKTKLKMKLKKAETTATEEATPEEVKAGECLKETIGAIRTLCGRLYGNMGFAKRDIGWGKLGAEDLGEIFSLVQNVTIPTSVSFLASP